MANMEGIDEKIIATIKKESIEQFFIDNVVQYVKSERSFNNTGTALQDHYYIKKTPSFLVGYKIKFEMEEFVSGTNRPLLSTYIYQLEEYDDICLKLQLVNFITKHNENFKY